MFKAISDLMAHCYVMLNSITVVFNFFNAKKIIGALMLFISNHYGIKCLSNLLLLETCIIAR